MLMPKRVKRRRVHRGRMKGKATRGNTVNYGRVWPSGDRAGLDHEQPDRGGAYRDDKIYQKRRTCLDQDLSAQAGD